MDYYNKYIIYKKKYIDLKNYNFKKLNQIGGKNIKEIVNKLYFFKADWCGHCQNLKPVWEKLKKKYNKKIEFIEMDSEKNKDNFIEWGIQAFPTIIFRKNTNAVEYNGSRDIKSLTKFCKDMINHK